MSSGTEGKGDGKDSGIEEEGDSSGILKHKSTIILSLDKATRPQLPSNEEPYQSAVRENYF